MGALTDNRKRSLTDQRNPFAAAYPLSELLSSEAPPSKKPKFSSPPPATAAPDRMARPDGRPPPVVTRLYPPVLPLSRRVHAPQQNVKAFGLGTSASRRSSSGSISWTDKNTEMGLVSQLVRAKRAYLSPLLRPENGEVAVGPGSNQQTADIGGESLGLEEYKRLVLDEQDACFAASEPRPAEVPAPPDSDLPIVTQKDEEPSDLYVLNRSLDDAGKMVLEATPVRAGSRWVKGKPLYKELHEDSRKNDSKLESLGFEQKFTEASLSTIRLLQKKPKEDLSGPYAPLTDEEDDDVNHALEGGNRHEVLVRHEASCIDITREVLQCLRHGAWLNDEVINLYLELLKERERREPKNFLKCHFFSTFFYKKVSGINLWKIDVLLRAACMDILKSYYDLISGRNGYDFKAVKRWTSQKKLGYSLIECDKIFVPVHKQVHWCLAVINVKDKKFQYLDSLGGMDMMALRVLARYFMDEVKDKSDKQMDTMSWKQEEVENLPLQKNGWDCGMFMLKYTDFYSRGVSLNFGQEHMDYFRKRTIKEILRLRAE